MLPYAPALEGLCCRAVAESQYAAINTGLSAGWTKHKHVHINSDKFFKLNVTSTRGHPYKLFKHRSYHIVRSSFFSERVVNIIWNDLGLTLAHSSPSREPY